MAYIIEDYCHNVIVANASIDTALLSLKALSNKDNGIHHWILKEKDYEVNIGKNDLYRIYDEQEEVIAEYLSLNTAIMLLKALCENYSGDRACYIISKMEGRE